MNVSERLKLIHNMCIELSYTSSRIDKEYIVKTYKSKDEQLAQDIDYVFEILSGVHKLGYTFIIDNREAYTEFPIDCTLREYLSHLYNIHNFDRESVSIMCSKYRSNASYILPIVNRVWRIGINKSQIAKQDTSPMLAKKYEPGKHCTDINEEYYITEKLDGNRCIAKYDEENNKWIFLSRSGKTLKVNFDMEGLATHFTYDGEILSIDQIENPGQHNFNSLSGKVNSIYGDKSGLVYFIFDIVNTDLPYKDRRGVLNAASNLRGLPEHTNTYILPLINCLKADTMPRLQELLELIENKGGEGLMINLGSRKYEHKRTDALLKVKSTYTMDMKVLDIEYGTGKYEGLVGALYCEAYDGNVQYFCKVGSGLSDDERYNWSIDTSLIIGKIIEVAYFSLSQDKNTLGTLKYSLRFPRFKRIRTDKTETSVY